MYIDRDKSGRITAAFTVRQSADQEALGAGSSELVAFLSGKADVPALKAKAIAAIRAQAERYRAQAIGPHPGKHQSYRVKAEVARRILDAGPAPDEADVALFRREAVARDLKVEDLAALVLAKARDYEKAAFRVEGFEAEALAEIRALGDDDPTTADAIETLLSDLARRAAQELSMPGT